MAVHHLCDTFYVTKASHSHGLFSIFHPIPRGICIFWPLAHEGVGCFHTAGYLPSVPCVLVPPSVMLGLCSICFRRSLPDSRCWWGSPSFLLLTPSLAPYANSPRIGRWAQPLAWQPENTKATPSIDLTSSLFGPRSMVLHWTISL